MAATELDGAAAAAFFPLKLLRVSDFSLATEVTAAILPVVKALIFGMAPVGRAVLAAAVSTAKGEVVLALALTLAAANERSLELLGEPESKSHD